jgi:hypothetical protein
MQPFWLALSLLPSDDFKAAWTYGHDLALLHPLPRLRLLGVQLLDRGEDALPGGTDVQFAVAMLRRISETGRPL